MTKGEAPGPNPEPAPKVDQREYIHLLRRFHFEGSSDAALNSGDGGAYLPAALPGLSGQEKRSPYPLLLVPGESDSIIQSVDPDKGLAASDHAFVIDLNDQSALHIFRAAVKSRLAARRTPFRVELGELCTALRGMLEVDRLKRPEARAPEHLSQTVGATGSQFMDPTALSELFGERRGSVAMATERRERLESALATMEAHLALDTQSELVVVHDHSFSPAKGENDPGSRFVQNDDPCTQAVAEFDRMANDHTPLFLAVRMARLEAEGRYRADRHEIWFRQFGPSVFTAGELALLPVVVAIENADRLQGDGIHTLSCLLASSKPIHVIASVDPAGYLSERDPGKSSIELGYFGLSHRNAFVQQSSPTYPKHLLKGFLQALDGILPALHMTERMVGDAENDLVLYADGGLASRSHPFFRYDPAAGTSWARRMDFTDNPQPEQDWPLFDLADPDDGDQKTGEKEVFTLADFALLRKIRKADFLPLQDGVSKKYLAPLAEYLDLDKESSIHKIPYIRAVGENGPVLLAVTRTLAMACRDRLDYWRTLQELAGIKSEYVREAVEKAVQEAHNEAAAERDRTQLRHEDEITKVREETTEKAMAGLAQSLLGLDLATELAGGAATSTAPAPAAPSPAAVPPPAAEATAEAAAPAPAAAEEEDEEFSEEPWVETALCTSCNDCVNINAKIFVYDDNNQVIIGDPRGGLYREIVLAAEGCPADCIHPGQPFDPKEPNLDEWVTRAERYQ